MSIPAQICQLILVISNIKNKLTNLCGNRHLQNDFIDTFCETKMRTTPDLVAACPQFFFSSFLLSSLELSDTKVYGP